MSLLSADSDSKARRRFRRGLVAWYARHARSLPWRETADPYAIWISEIMLQQTTVVAVIPYYERFLSRFPNVQELAAAREDEVLKLWEGLGYYSRARNIHKTAKLIAADRGGEFPSDPDNLQKFPGIGRYTAGAIASFAFDRKAPILEANTRRLYARLVGYRGDPRGVVGERRLWQFAEEILPRKNPGRFNQALMELGATVCTPENPGCEWCPARSGCVAFANGWQQEIPIPARRPRITAVSEVAIAVQRDGRYLLTRRPAGERWAGLWDFIRFPWDDTQGDVNLARHVRTRIGLVIEIGERLAELRHSVTRFRITLSCYAATWQSGESHPGPAAARWVGPQQFSRYPLSVTGRKLAKLIQERHTE